MWWGAEKSNRRKDEACYNIGTVDIVSCPLYLN